MKNEDEIKKLLSDVRIVMPPKHQLATFGTTTLQYVVLSAIRNAGECRLRRGEVTAQKPKIITPDLWRKRFEGFGEEQAAFGEAIEKIYGQPLRALEYVFKNDLKETALQHTPLDETVQRIQDAIRKDDAPRTGLLLAPDAAWSLAIMKFIIDMSLRSFPTHLQELGDRGFFDPAGRERARQSREIERLFRDARDNPAARQALGTTLKSWGLFEEYEDRFFSLFAQRSR